jgi:hypothetical protein
VYYWLLPFIGEEQTYWEKFDKREDARDYLHKVKKNPLFLKNDEIKQYKCIQLDPL